MTKRGRKNASASPYSVRKVGDNYALYFRGSLAESGIFASRKTALKHKQIAERDWRSREARLKSNTGVKTRKGKTGSWIKAKAVKVTRVKGKLVVQVKR